MKDNEVRNNRISITVAVIIAASLFIICDVFFKIVTYELNDNHFYIYPYTLLFSIFFGFFRATLICYIFIFIISLLNLLKATYSGEPLYFSDVNFLGNSSGLLQLVADNISASVVINFLISAGIFAAILTLIVLLNRKFNFEVKHESSRVAMVVLSCSLLALLFFPNSFTKNLYLKLFFNTDNHVGFDTYTTNLNFYAKNGFINGMYGVELNSKFTPPSNYDESFLDGILQTTADIQFPNTLGKPNIIVFFSEAYWDIDQLDEVEFNIPVSYNFNNLKNEGEFVNLVSPSYGGLSENVAFELLTGANMNYFPNGYIPVMSLYSRNNSDSIPSFVKELKNNGYTSNIIFGKDYYNSRKAYTTMGFDNYVELVEPGQLNVSDEYMTDYLIEQLENDRGTNNLYVVETIASHMPYTDDKYENFDVEVVNSHLSDNMNSVLKSYAQGIYNADIQLQKLYDYIKNYDEPTIIIFLGDHLPYLDTADKENVIDCLDYFNTDDDLLNNYRLYNTQALMLSNFNMDLDLPEYLGTDVLFDYLANYLDIELENSSYYKWLLESTRVLPASNKYVSLDADGNLYRTNELDGEMKELYNTKELMQYKFFVNGGSSI